MRALVIIAADSFADFDAAVKAARKVERVQVVVLDEKWDLPEHDALIR